MQVFYIEIDKFKEKYNKNFLIPYADIAIKTEKRFYEYTIGRYLVKQIAQKYYNIKNTEIIIDKYGKPVFKDADLHFSISHSKNIVIACFDEFPCGIDIEYIKNRNLENLSAYFNKNFKTLVDFYKFWTYKEAKYKIKHKYKYANSYTIIEDYFVTLLGKNNLEKVYPVDIFNDKKL